MNPLLVTLTALAFALTSHLPTPTVMSRLVKNDALFIAVAPSVILHNESFKNPRPGGKPQGILTPSNSQKLRVTQKTLANEPSKTLSLGVTIAETTFAALDFEAAGAVPDKPDVPIQIGIATGQLGAPPQLYDSFLSIDRPVTRGAQRVHGITNEQLLGSPSLLQLFPTLQEQLGNRPLVAHAHGTEKRFLASLPGHPFGPWIDTLKLARKVYPQAESHKLGRLCDDLDLTPSLRTLVPNRDWHDALFDAAASLLILFHIVEELDLADQPLEILR